MGVIVASESYLPCKITIVSVLETVSLAETVPLVVTLFPVQPMANEGGAHALVLEGRRVEPKSTV